MKYEAPICEMMNVNAEDIIRTSTSFAPIEDEHSQNQN